MRSSISHSQLMVVVKVSSVVLLLLYSSEALNLSRESQHSSFNALYGSYEDSDSHVVAPESKKVDETNRKNVPRQAEDKEDLIFGQISPKTIDFLLRAASKRDADITADSKDRNKKNDKNYWSGLENYYQRLRDSHATPAQQRQTDFYQFIQQQDLDDSYPKPVPFYQESPNYRITYNLPSAPKNSAFTLPFSSYDQPPIDIRAPSLSVAPGVNFRVNSDPAYIDPDFGFSVYQPAPGISRTGGIGSGSILLGNNNQQFPLPTVSSIDKTATKTVDPIDEQKWKGMIGMLQQRPVNQGSYEDLYHQRLQERLRHQQDTFGPWYNHQRSREFLREEGFCGPRNHVQLRASPLKIKPNDMKSVLSRYNPAQLSRLQIQTDPKDPLSQLDVPVAFSAGEYPSHMGVYNGSSPSDTNYLCGATWIHEKFALTLASCVQSMQPSKLIVRAGEWKLNRNTTKPADPPMLLREVRSIHLFSNYTNTTKEHNLALLEFERPVEYLAMPYICPACQMYTRSSMRMNSCWTPVRNISNAEIFDAEGVGESKMLRMVDMIELPIRLFANDDECSARTKEDFFNYRHPNYICSADYKQSDWRMQLNQTEYFGSGIYCNEGGHLSLVSMVHPIHTNSSSAYGYIDLSYYKPWMRNVISGSNSS